MADNIISNLTDRLASLPGIGRKSAKRLSYYIINMPKDEIDNLINAIKLAKDNIKKCKICGNYSDSEICNICSNPNRNRKKLMIIQSVKDVDLFESSMCYNGLYFILDEESLDPLRGIGPDELGTERLRKRLQDEEIEEVILAFNSNTESDQTKMYIKSVAEKYNKKVTQISQGIPAGGVLEFFDAETIRRSFEGRQEF